MRRSLFILAVLALAPALHAQADNARFTREQVLEIFAQYNPSVLERAQADEDYNTVLESFLAAYENSQASAARTELIAVARNFDNSIRLQVLTNVYKQAVASARLMGRDTSSADNMFREDLTDVFSRVWAVTVRLRQYELAETKRALKTVRADKTLPKAEREAQMLRLKKQIRSLKAEIKSLKQHRGEAVSSAVDAYMLQIQEEQTGLLQAARDAAAAAGTENLQIKSKNKKPVAK